VISPVETTLALLEGVFLGANPGEDRVVVRVAVAPHTGRGGWSWYTGSAGWLYRLMLESLLGLTRTGDRLRITPCLPTALAQRTIRYIYRTRSYE
jgi:cellobiose phosphorylase